MLAPPLLKLLITHLAAAPQFVLVGRVELAVEFAKLAVHSHSEYLYDILCGGRY